MHGHPSRRAAAVALATAAVGCGLVGSAASAQTSADYAARFEPRAKITSDGTVRYAVICPANTLRSCSGTAVLTSREKVGGRLLTIATTTFDQLAPGQIHRVSARPSRTVRSWLRKQAPAKLVGRVKNESPDGIIPTIQLIEGVRAR